MSNDQLGLFMSRCVRGPLTKDILWMDDHVLVMTYESLATRSLKRHRLDTT